MALLVNLLELVDSNEINLIAETGPIGVVHKSDIPESAMRDKVIGIGVDTVSGKHTLTIRLKSMDHARSLDGYCFEDGM